MGIQINGQTDTVSAIDGTINVGGIDLNASNSDIPGDLNVSGDLNVTGVITANSFTGDLIGNINSCLLYTSPSPRDQRGSRMPSSA